MFKLLDSIAYASIIKLTQFKFWVAKRLVTFTLKNLFNPIFWMIVVLSLIAYYVYIVL
jgi:hypothetical protein